MNYNENMKDILRIFDVIAEPSNTSDGLAEPWVYVLIIVLTAVVLVGFAVFFYFICNRKKK